MPDMALAGIKVLDFTQFVAGPYCTKLLADYGADVIKVERPGQGDGARRMGPFPGDVPHPEMSGLFLHLNTNKKGITLDLKQPAARNIAMDLVKEVDLVVESFRPGTMDAFGLGYDALRGINPQLVMTPSPTSARPALIGTFAWQTSWFTEWGARCTPRGWRSGSP